MSGRLIGIFLILCGVAAGAGLYYTQVYAYYNEVETAETKTLNMVGAGSGDLRELIVSEFQAVDKTSSPLGYRACFSVSNSFAMLTESYELIEAVPLEAPVWFDCFDADEIGLAIDEGRALTFLSEHEIQDGVDRVVAVMDDGRGFAWHQLNEKYKD